MSELASEIMTLSGGWAWVLVAVFLRIGAAMALLPAFGEHMVPIRIKLALAIAFTIIVAPAVVPIIDLPEPSLPALVRLAASETICGLALGIAIRMMVWLLQVAGSIAAQSTSLAQILGATGVDPQPAISQLLVISGLALACATGLHVRMAETLIVSYEVMSIGQFPVASDMSRWGVGLVAHMFSTAFTFAAPFVIASLIYNVALGVINRAMPQLMVAFVGAPAITAGGLILLLLTAPLVLSLWLEALHLRLANPFGALP